MTIEDNLQETKKKGKRKKSPPKREHAPILSLTIEKYDKN